MRFTPAVSLVLVTVAAAATAGSPVDAQRAPLVETATSVPVQVITRERLADRNISLLTLIRTQPKPFDEVRISLPSDKRLTAGQLPTGWTHEQKGKQIRASGPALTDARLRFDLSNGQIVDFVNKTSTVELFSGGSPGQEYRSVISAIERVDLTPNIEGILTVTPYGTPGYPLTLGTTDAYRDGDWNFKLDGGSTWPVVQPSRFRTVRQRLDDRIIQQFLDYLNSLPDPKPLVTTFPDRPITGVTYTDPWGELRVDAPLKIEAAPHDASCTARLTGGSQYAFAGQAACVSGCFPDYTSEFRLNSSLKVSPWAFSPTAVMLGIPADTAPGSYTIGGPGISGTVTVGVLSLEGSIDTNSLWRGQSTTMRLKILGTDQALPIVVLNRTPGIINVEGGVYQTITTPGGADNAVTRSVRGIHKGNFNITYSLNLPGCGARR
jgi:hypothetical protein